MRIIVLCIIGALCATPALADASKPGGRAFAPPPASTFTQRIADNASAYVPKYLGVQGGYAGYKFESSRTVIGVKQGHKGFLLGASIKF